MAELTQEGAGGTLAALCEVKGNARGVLAARIDRAYSCGKLRSDALEQAFCVGKCCSNVWSQGGPE